MRVVFADTLYFIALINPQDQWRANAINADNVVRESRLITTRTVLIEILNFTSGYGSNLPRLLRRLCVTYYRMARSKSFHTLTNCS